MRLVFVNHAHPALAHVSGMRLGSFSRSMAARGHEVVLLTSTLPGATDDPIEPVSTRLSRHDWGMPLTIPVAPLAGPSEPANVPALVRRGLTLGRFLKYGGVHDRWTSAVKPCIGDLVSAFRPQAVWGTFGNTSNLVLAQAVARAARCPWVIDVKDNWTTFLRPGVRELMAWRFRDAVGYTSNASHHEQIASRFLWQQRTQVVYSGVAEAFFASSLTLTSAPKQFMLVGSTYDGVRLRRFLHVAKEWIDGLSPSDRHALKFVYAGSDHDRVRQALAEVALPCAVEVTPQLSIEELAQRCRVSFANCYLWAEFTFHHKLLELLVSGRPVVSFPGEAAESLRLASLSPTPFASCANAGELLEALTRAWNRRDAPPVVNTSQPWKWSDRAAGLDAFFSEIVRRPAQCAA